MNYILFDANRESLFPLTHTRPISEIRIGILTIKEKWIHHLGSELSTKTADYLQMKYPLQKEANNVYIHGGVCPNKALVAAIQQLADGEGLYAGDTLVAYRNAVHQKVSFTEDFTQIEKLWHIFQHNTIELKADFDLLTEGRSSQALSDSNLVLGSENIFVEEGAKVEGAILNATTGPIYIGKNAELMEGSIVRGPLAMCEHSVLKLGAKIYGSTTLGPYCKVGGEVNNSVLMGYSNKGHDGFLGNSVLGEWCNIGADTNSSNLKNNYADVRLWSEQTGCFEKTGLQFCGLIMGDHSKCGINTMFNTGTVVGVSANIFGAGFPRNFVPSFAWGGSAGYSTYHLPKVFEVAEKVMARRGVAFDDTEKDILQQVFELTSEQRNF
ncbi:MAG: glucose-1-phosphate thymidylyltransferase [Flavobacteriales bacterium]|nr:glucose-1-phosphate thymidylyltransferase [Flavobacteriales bacterium]|tara:strand:+ start:1071 stop:2216 length:1146 start_codon:yes stop_codon:yes gene_type:complete